MTLSLRLALAALALIPAPALFAAAAVAAPAADDPAYDLLVTTLEGTPEARANSIEPTVNAAIDGLANAFPPIAQAMQANPSMRPELSAALRPVIVDIAEASRPALRAALRPVLVKNLTPQDAQSLADFYGSPLGRRLSASVLSSYRPEKTVAAGIESRPVGGDTVMSDAMKAGMTGFGNLSEEDAAAVLAFAATPAGQRFNAIVPDLAAARATVENGDPGPQFQQRMNDALIPVLTRYLGVPSN